jgi:hypothetical protein
MEKEIKMKINITKKNKILSLALSIKSKIKALLGEKPK